MIMVIMVHYEQSFHLCKWFHYLQMGCPIFFAASGFGICGLINKKFGGSLDSQSIKQFYFSRYKALAPAWYLAFLVFFTVNTLLLYTYGKTLQFGNNRDLLSIVCNIFFLNGLLPFCNNNVIPGGCYIGATVILYALTPMILAAIRKFKNRKLFFAVSSCAGMLVWTILFRIFKNDFSKDGFSYFIFLVHYPNYLLGIMLYLDLSESMLTTEQIKRCLPLGLMAYAVAVVLFYSPIPYGNMFSAWMTALATYLVLYYLLSNEKNYKPSLITKVLSAFGRNSYCIYLLHVFCVWTFVPLLGDVLGRIDINFYTIPWFIIMIPVVLALSYLTGYLFRIIVRNVTKLLFKNG